MVPWEQQGFGSSLGTSPEESPASLSRTWSWEGDSPATNVAAPQGGWGCDGGGERSRKEKHDSSRRLSSSPSQQDVQDQRRASCNLP